MTAQSVLLFRARCPRCRTVRALLPSGLLYRHLPCGRNVLPAPTVIGIELDGFPFPEDVVRVVNANGVELHRTPQGWALKNGSLPNTGRFPLPEHGPYQVLAIADQT